MTDDRDNRRNRDPLHPGSGKGRAVSELDDTWQEERTPVGSPAGSRRRRRPDPLPDPPVTVDPAAFDPDVRWREFDEMRREVTACAEDRKRSARWKRWLFATLVPSAGGVVGLLVWAVTKLDARADAAAEERLRVQMIQRHETEIRVLQLQQAATAAVLGLRTGSVSHP